MQIERPLRELWLHDSRPGARRALIRHHNPLLVAMLNQHLQGSDHRHDDG
jgi:hypothetical protein